MKQEIYDLLLGWPKAFITDTDLSAVLEGTDASRYGLVNRAIKEGFLIHVRRGLYVISLPGRSTSLNLFELSQFIYGPSFVSLESALQYHDAIPEAIYSITGVTIKRSNEFSTPVGDFSYQSVPKAHFLLGVKRIEQNNASFFLATPWRAIADLMYVQRKSWDHLDELCEDMRIEIEWIQRIDNNILGELKTNYPNKKIREILNNFFGEIK